MVRDHPDGSTYVVWHSRQGLISVGTRAEVRAVLVERFLTIARSDAMLARVDELGTSMPEPNGVGDPQFGWADPQISSRELWPDGPIGWLPRGRLVNFARALAAGDDAAAAALLEPAEPAEPDAPKDPT